MKKKFLPVLALAAGIITGLSSCGGDKASTSVPTPPDSTGTSTPVPSTPDVKDFYSVSELLGLFSGTPGASDFAYTGPGTVTVQGIYFSTGDGNYYDGRAGYLQDETTGDLFYMHFSKSGLANIATEVMPGAVIKVTGQPTVYNALPQMNGNWTYELVTPTSDTAVAKLYESYTPISIADIFGSDGSVSPDMLLKPVKISSAVMTSPALDSTNLTYFTELDHITDADAPSIGLYRFKTQSSTDYVSGGLYDIYGTVTAYKGKPQLHVNAVTTEQKFKSVQKVDLADLDDAKMLAVQKLYTDVKLDDVTFDFRNSTPIDQTVTLRQAQTGARVIWTVDPSYSDYAIIEKTAYKTTLTFKAGEKSTEVSSKKAEVKVVRRVCVGAAAATEEACLAAGIGGSGSAGSQTPSVSEGSNFFEETKTVNLKYVYDAETSVTGTFNNSVPSGFKYITNNDQYPAPSYESSTGALKLAYVKGGLSTDVVKESQKGKLTLNLKASDYCKEGSTCDAHSLKVTVSMMSKTGSEVATLVSDELFNDAQKDAYRDVVLDLDAGESKTFAYVKVIVTTNTAATLYVKTVTLAIVA